MVTSSTTHPLVSIVVPTFNSGSSLERLARSIQSQTYRNWETIIVDNESTDETPRIASKYGFRYFAQKGNRVFARNFGAKSAAGDFLLLLDCDHELDARCIEELVARPERDSDDAVVLMEKSATPGKWGELLAAEDELEFELDLALPRWFKAKAFDSEWSLDLPVDRHVHGEDRMLLTRLIEHHKRIGKEPLAIVYHYDPDFARYFRKQFQNTRYGTESELLPRYVRVAFPSLVKTLALRSLVRSSKGPTAVAIHYFFLSIRLLFQSSGMLLGRIRTIDMHMNASARWLFRGRR